ncbi:hypothetical protein IMSHALPRED_004890 [Imshaugia aleurites]|uniref:Uncharacterized protein n=1 Tax=Imshaugia aleurites TaxID=172621 RepID=A0A8H3F6T2_9LECA|nr:hypothetical protein IMSHALPRED_004890 [Imshaugia aleurites]
MSRLLLGCNRPPLEFLSSPLEMLVLLPHGQWIVVDALDVKEPENSEGELRNTHWKHHGCKQRRIETDYDKATYLWPQVRPAKEEAVHGPTFRHNIYTASMGSRSQEQESLPNIKLAHQSDPIRSGSS